MSKCLFENKIKHLFYGILSTITTTTSINKYLYHTNSYIPLNTYMYRPEIFPTFYLFLAFDFRYQHVGSFGILYCKSAKFNELLYPNLLKGFFDVL